LVIVSNLVRRNFHRDSVQLLQLSESAKKIDGVTDAAVVMGTSTNKEILAKLGLLTGDGKGATDSDMILAVSAQSQALIEKGLALIQEMVLKPPTSKGQRYYSVEAALQALPDANLAVISIPGEYAREVVLKVLDKGLNVHLFSDHVPSEHELELKQYASQRGLFVMGPGAGTALLGGKAVGFANVVREGNAGIVAAAGTGLQEVSVLLSEAGVGISAGLGTGGGDVKDKIGGIMMLQSIDALEKDSTTKLVIVVSKPPDSEVKSKLLEHIANATKKRYVTCFLGGESYNLPELNRNRVKGTKTLHAAILEAIRSVKGTGRVGVEKRFEIPPADLLTQADRIAKDLKPNQKYLRGLYTGGTLAYETLVILDRMLGRVYSNAPLDSRPKLSNSNLSVQDSIVDLGDEEFTAGRAHPMIDPTVRQLRLVEEARDRDVAVIMMDVMLGYGSHPDPAGAMLEAITEARQIAKSDDRSIPILAHVCGTEQDPQPLSQQVKKLKKAGVHVFPTNAMMAIAGVLITRRGTISEAILKETYKDLLGSF
jgi:FdrA protein